MADASGRAPSDQDIIRHDLRTHLSHVVGYAELLLDELEGDEATTLTPALEDVCSSARLAAALVTESLGASGAEPTAVADVVSAIEVVSARAAELRDATTALPESTVSIDVGRIELAADAARVLAAEFEAAPPAGEHKRDTAAAALDDDDDQSTEGNGRLILVVDDDEFNRDLLARRVERLGYDVAVAEDGQQALGLLEVEPVDLVLLDLMMPGMSGFDVLEYRNQDERLREIPVVMISSESEAASVARSIKMGAEDYLPKPFDPVVLRARVGACLERKRLRDQERTLAAEVQRQAAELAAYSTNLEERVRHQVDEIARLARLRRFLSPQLADLVVSSGSEDVLRTHRREIAVLFCDLRGFTSFSEISEPEEVMSVLHEFHDAMGALTHDFGATVGFFAGDGIMVFFNDPLPCPNPAEQAVRMAVALRDRMATMARDWLRRGHDVGFGVGISFGFATLGEIGFEGRYDYGVIGSVVNLAARLCDQAKHGQILISKRANTEVEDVAITEEVGDLTLKGLHGPVRAYNVIGLKESSVTAPVT